MRRWVALGVGLALLGCVLATGGTMSYSVLAGKLAVSVGDDNSWVNPSSIRARPGHVIPIEVFNGLSHARTFTIEKIAPYDSEMVDAVAAIDIDADALILEANALGVFHVRITGRQSGEAWIRIAPEPSGTLSQAWIIRIRM